MYHKASISPLSSTQISKILNGHSVRISSGNGHDIELSKEQLKKFAKAQKSGKGMTVTMDPYQMQNHQHLRGTGVSRTKKYNKWVDTLGARPVIEAGMTRSASAISGTGVSRTKKYNNWVDTLGARPVIEAGMTRSASEISGSGVSRRKKFNKWVDTLGARPVIDAGMASATEAMSGSGRKRVNRLKKANRWTDYAIGTVNNGIHLADNAVDVYKKATQPNLKDMLGFGLKKRSPRKRRGGALMPAGIP
jgi:hypothetical protein